MTRKCCVCGGTIKEGGYDVLGYNYHAECFPFTEAQEKQRCYFCHKIIRRGDRVVSLGDLGVGAISDRACSKCADKHYKDH